MTDILSILYQFMERGYNGYVIVLNVEIYGNSEPPITHKEA